MTNSTVVIRGGGRDGLQIKMDVARSGGPICFRWKGGKRNATPEGEFSKWFTTPFQAADLRSAASLGL